MRRLSVLIGVFFLLSLPALAGTVLLSPTNALPSGYSLVDSLTSPGVPVVENPLSDVTLISAVYANGSQYLYVYQLVNDNAHSTLHRLTINNFKGLADATLGYFSVNPDASVFSYDSVAADNQLMLGTTDNETVGFSIEVPACTDSFVMFVLSNEAPSDVPSTALIQNSGQACAEAVTPWPVLEQIPEPATMLLMVAGGLLIRKRK